MPRIWTEQEVKEHKDYLDGRIEQYEEENDLVTTALTLYALVGRQREALEFYGKDGAWECCPCKKMHNTVFCIDDDGEPREESYWADQALALQPEDVLKEGG